MRVAVLTISDATARGERADGSGDAAAAWVQSISGQLVGRAVVSDDSVPIVRQLLDWCDGNVADLVLTTGGTGLTPTDGTPEATRPLLDREVPGLAEALRARGVANGIPTAVLSRGLAGLAGRTLVVNLPGSTGGVKDALAVLADVLPHALSQAHGGDH
jgi:molybdenum cofactor synthesis domain-containing protein